MSLNPSLKKQLLGHTNHITALDYSQNAKQIVTSSLDSTVVLWDLQGNKRMSKLRGHKGAVKDVAFSPRNQFIASASSDKTVELWVPTGRLGGLTGHLQAVTSVQFSADGSKILTASDDQTLKLWSCQAKQLISSFTGHKSRIRCARFSNKGTMIASCSDDNTSKIWSPNITKCIHTFRTTTQANCLSWHPSGVYFAIGTANGEVTVYDTRNCKLAQFYSVHKDCITGVSFHPYLRYIACSSNDGTIKILNLMEGNTSFTFTTGHNGAVNAVRFSPTGKSIASGGSDKKLYVWKTDPSQ